MLLGLLVREGFSFWTGHPYDFEVWIRTGYEVAHGSNPYLHPWPPVPGVSFGYLGQSLPSAAYLPFWPAVFGGSYRLWELVGGGNRFVLYFLLKQGPILGDLAIAVLLYRLVWRSTGNRRQAVAALAFWALFPYDVVISAIWGQLDSVTTALILAALLLSEARSAARSLLWGVGIFVKWVTAIFLPLEVLRLRGGQRIWPFVAVGLAAGLTLLVFVTLDWGFGGIVATSTSQTAGGGGGMNYARLFGLYFLAPVLANPAWLGTALPDLWVPGVIVAGAIAYRWARTGTAEQELRAVLFVTVIWLLLRWGLYEQYFLYVFALLVFDIFAFHPQRRRFLYYLVGVAAAFLLFNDGFGIWFASPVTPTAFTLVQNFDNDPFWGPFRFDVLYALAVLMTASLVQLAWVVYRDERTAQPWLLRMWPRGGPGTPAPERPAAHR